MNVGLLKMVYDFLACYFFVRDDISLVVVVFDFAWKFEVRNLEVVI